jgi:hypothetical protein
LCLCGTSKNASCISLHFAYVAYFREVFPLYIDDIDVSQFIFFSIHTKLWPLCNFQLIYLSSLNLHLTFIPWTSSKILIYRLQYYSYMWEDIFSYLICAIFLSIVLLLLFILCVNYKYLFYIDRYMSWSLSYIYILWFLNL